MNHIVLATSVTLLAVVIPGLGSAAQAPDFSGTWEMDLKRSESAHVNTPSVPLILVIKQTDTELSIETRRRDQSETLVYRLDGSKSEKPAQDNGPLEWHARWEGTKLVTETHRNINRATVTIREILSLDAKAKEMTVERTFTVQHGYSMSGTRNYSSARDVFVKSR